MKITVTVEFEGKDAADRACDFLRPSQVSIERPKASGILGAGPFPPIVEQVEPAPKKSRAKKEKPVEPLAPEAIEAAPAPTVTQKDVEAALDRLFDDKGIEVTRAVLSRFGVNRGRDLKPEQYAAFVQKVEDVLAGKEV